MKVRPAGMACKSACVGSRSAGLPSINMRAIRAQPLDEYFERRDDGVPFMNDCRNGLDLVPVTSTVTGLPSRIFFHQRAELNAHMHTSPSTAWRGGFNGRHQRPHLR